MRKYVGLLILSLVLVLCGCALADVAINETNFPDSVFREIVKGRDMDEDGILSDEEIAAVQELYLSGCDFVSLEGIRVFTSLKDFSCTDCSLLTSLDLHGITTLQYLVCWDCDKLASVDLSGCSALENCRINSCGSLTSLHLSGCSALTTMNCSSCTELASLDVSPCRKLENLYTSYCSELAEIDLSGNSKLKNIQFDSCPKLASVDLSGHTSLEYVSCYSCNRLSKLLLNGCTSLINVNAASSALTTVDLTNCKSLRYLWLDCNKLEKLDLSSTPKLSDLSCSSNRLKSLNLKACSALAWLHVSDNRLTSLDLSRNTKLVAAHCYSNKLTSLKLGSNKSLVGLDIRYNKLTSLDVSKLNLLSKLVRTHKREHRKDGAGAYDAFENNEEYRFLYLDSKVIVKAGDFYSPEVKSVTVKNGKYKLSGKTATFTGPVDKNLTELVIQDTVKANGKTYKVTAIANKACKGMTKLKKVTVGKNVKTIGTDAFNGCKKLKNFIILSQKLVKVGAGAFTKVYKSIMFKCPSDLLRTYMRLLRDGNPPDTARYAK